MSYTDVHGSQYRLVPFVITILIGSFSDMLNQTVLGVAQPTLMKYFSIGASDIQWLTTGFLLASALMIPITVWLTNRFNTKRLFIASQIMFLLGTLACFYADNFSILLLGRIIQALGSGVAAPLSMTMLFSAFPPEKQGQAMGLLGIVFGLAPAIGPTFSGWAIDALNWRAIFGIVIPISILTILASFIFIKDVAEQHNSKLDFISVILSTLGFGGILYGFSVVGNKGWTSIDFIAAVVAGLFLTILFILRQLRIENPLMDVRIFKEHNFTVGTIIGSIVMIAMIGFEIVLPMYLQIVLGLSAIQAGLSLLAGALTMAFTSPIAGIALDKFGGKRLIIFGMAIVTLGTIPFGFLTSHSSIVYIIVLYAVRNFGMALALMPSGSVAFSALTPKVFADGSALNNVARQVAASIGTAILVSVFSNTTSALSPAKQLLKIDPMSYKKEIFNALLSGYHVAFLLASLATMIAFFISFQVRNNRQKEELKHDSSSTNH
ncbi:MDR family MFS transporter [Pediococcus argentinicus]|uniref:EmrB QacA subfamily drug resistance transporter n=1 Tax=Pediococcus argentinicus TaxID=480391 RepID=A0A0R2NAZ7_9LACO|nr:MDR family MFS transporter [Pediococcus argentinicus]KRO23070.1 EmrB QacA subfamily drug resistance transporter [Pediococcus argentinicus]NKZ22946.1 multidrug efflux MFS transporter [Pediococcus argentinicus]GEP20017.1 MFS transporter [Pediococcus argentinicus]